MGEQLLQSNNDMTAFRDVELIPKRLQNGAEWRTTVMLRNIPLTCTHSKLQAILKIIGLHDRYDFLHLPVDTVNKLHCGFAFVNFMSVTDVLWLYESVQTNWPMI